MRFKIVTFNIRYVYRTQDGANSFIHRAGMILDKIAKEAPHVICFQEVSDEIRSFLEKYLVDYYLVGPGRNKDLRGEGVSIAFRKDCMELLSLEYFWLSPTPDVPASRYEIQSPCPRICPSAVLKHRETGTSVRVYGVHLDHMSDEARILGMKQIMEKVEKDNAKRSYPTFILGDFNAFPDSETINFCNSFKTFEIVDVTAEIEATFHFFGTLSEPLKIDYIYTDKKTAKGVKSVCCWEECEDGIYLSDHYPVCLELEL